MKIHVCPLRTEFKFYALCPIEDCLHYTDQTSRSCILLDVSISDSAEYGLAEKHLSIPEILLYKRDSLNSISSRTASRLKKSGIERIKMLIALYYYIEYVVGHCYHSKLLGKLSKADSNLIQSVLSAYPLNLKLLKVDAQIVLKVIDPDYFSRFKSNFKQYDIKALELDKMLFMTPDVLHNLQKIGAKNDG
jgi:hypothetical protein